MTELSRIEAERLLMEAQKRNPGPWVQHSLYVGKAAEVIASYHPDLDPNTAYALGCVHDIGRREGVTDMRHVLDGFSFLQKIGFTNAAQIALTHSFPIQNANACAGKWDCTPLEFQIVQDNLKQIEYNLYDRLLQLCDALAMPSGFCLLEKRLLDVSIRHGVNHYSIPRWQAFLNLQQEFETAIGRSIYTILPGVIENTFGF